MAFIRTHTIAKPIAPTTGVTEGPAATMGSFPRITPRTVEEAYGTPVRDDCGRPTLTYRPVRGCWLDPTGRKADGLMAVLVWKTGREHEPPKGLREVAEALGMPLDYIRGFLCGWDSHRKPRVSAGVLVALGWADGRAAARACGLSTEEDLCLGR
jgi:hypothetical protein